MNFAETYRNPNLVKLIADQINTEAIRPMRFMEVCGGHTHSIRKFGISELLPGNVRLISGPGCPVCVTNYSYIDQAIGLLLDPDIILCSFGDLIRIPGSESSLEKEKSAGANVNIVLSALQALDIAKSNPSKQIVFLGIGFETTAPATAAIILEAESIKIENFSVYSAHKIMPPAMSALTLQDIELDGFICPGHVSTIAGSEMYDFLARDHSLACVVSGFEPVDLMHSILMLVRQINSGIPKVEIQYKRAVRPEGNQKALKTMWEVFNLVDDWWRGLGIIPESGLGIRDKYKKYNASRKFNLDIQEAPEPAGCACGDILRGKKRPDECKLFATVCSPDKPVGACMVSPEGACNASFKYGLGVRD